MSWHGLGAVVHLRRLGRMMRQGGFERLRIDRGVDRLWAGRDGARGYTVRLVCMRRNGSDGSLFGNWGLLHHAAGEAESNE